MTDVLMIAIALITLIAAMAAVAAAVTMVRRKVRKEIGYLIRHLRYKPARPPKVYRIDDQIGPG
jgi:hypothetical protein